MKITIFKLFAKSMLLQFLYISPLKNHPKTFSKRSPSALKIGAKNVLSFDTIVSRSNLDFGKSSASKLEPYWPSWAPRTLPKASKIQFFGHMCPRCFPRGSKVAPKRHQGGPRGRFSEYFRGIWQPFFVIFGCEI